MPPAAAASLEVRPEKPSMDLRRPCGPSSRSAPALLAYEWMMRSLRCSSLSSGVPVAQPREGPLDHRISRRGFPAAPRRSGTPRLLDEGRHLLPHALDVLLILERRAQRGIDERGVDARRAQRGQGPRPV